MLADSQLIIEKFKEREEKYVLLLGEKDSLIQSLEDDTVQVIQESESLTDLIRGMATKGAFGLRIARHLRKFEKKRHLQECNVF
jgi:hypothetical protein